jgi:hypothetical protein
MEKIAQKRSVLNKLKEMTNISGKAAETFFNPQFQKVMDDLRAKDDSMRSIVAGEVIGNGDPGDDPIALKALLKTSKTSLNRREYMAATADLGRFHKKVADVVALINSLDNSINEVHHQFLFQDLDDEKKQHLEKLKNRWSAAQQAALIKEASSIMDFFHNIMSNRGRALGLYEKRYPKQVSKLKKDAVSLQSRSEGLLAIILTVLKEMAAARATRNPEQYIKAGEKIKKAYQNYDAMFKDFYNSNVKGFLEKVDPVPTASKPNDAGLGNQEVGTSNLPIPLVQNKSVQITDPNSMGVAPTAPTEYAPPSGNTPTSAEQLDLVNPKIPAPPLVPTNVGEPIDEEDILTEPQMEKPVMETNPVLPTPTVMYPTNVPNADPARKTLMQASSSHREFVRSLEALANEDPLVLSAYIRKYATSIQQTDPLKAIQLFNIAKSIRG